MPKLATFLLGFQGPVACLLIFIILLACGLGVPIPEDITLIAAGILAYYKAADIFLMIFICYMGIMIGDTFIFMMGKRFGPSITRHRFIARILPPKRLVQVQDTLQKRGNKILFAARFMPGLRAPLFFTAGTLGVSFKTFLLYDGLAAMISVPAIVYSVFHFGQNLEEVIMHIKAANSRIVIFILVIAIGFGLKWWIGQKKAKLEAQARS